MLINGAAAMTAGHGEPAHVLPYDSPLGVPSPDSHVEDSALRYGIRKLPDLPDIDTS